MPHSKVADLDRWFSTTPRFPAPQDLAVIEIEDCLDERGDLIAGHPFAWIVEQAEQMRAAYIERNRSGRGVMIIAQCSDRHPDRRQHYRYTPIGGDHA